MADQRPNGRNQINFDIHLGDLLMLMEATRLAANTEMMCGRRGAEKRLREYQARLNDMIPHASRLFDGGDWCEINMALGEATSYQVEILDHHPVSYRWSSYCPSGKILIRVGDQSWTSKSYDFKEDSDEFRSALELLEELRPMDCERETAPTVVPESS